MLCAVVWCLCGGAGTANGQTNANKTVRLAIVDQGPAVANLPVADLLFKELSSLPGLELLERQNIGRVLREQSISLTAVGDQSGPCGGCGG